MWNPPIVLTSEEQKIAARTRKTRKFLCFCASIAMSCSTQICSTRWPTAIARPGGHEPVEAGLLALATLLQAYCHVGDRDAVELTVMDKRWQMVLDCLGAEHPPSVRAPCLTSGCDSSPTTWTRPCWIGPSHWRSTPEASVPGNCARSWTPRRCSALQPGRRHVEPARPCAAQGGGPGGPGHWTRPRRYLWRTQGCRWWDTAVSKRHWTWIGGAQRTLPRAGLGPGGGGTVATLAEQQHTLAAQTPPLQEVMETITQLIMQDTEPDPGVDRAGDVSSSTSHLTGASLSRIKTCATVAKAVPKPSTVLKSTLPWIWIAPSPGRWWSARRIRT